METLPCRIHSSWKRRVSCCAWSLMFCRYEGSCLWMDHERIQRRQSNQLIANNAYEGVFSLRAASCGINTFGMDVRVKTHPGSSFILIRGTWRACNFITHCVLALRPGPSPGHEYFMGTDSRLLTASHDRCSLVCLVVVDVNQLRLIP